MNKRDFYSKFFISQVDTRILSKTYADYAKNMAEKASSKVAYITDFDDNFNVSDLQINTSSIMIIPCEDMGDGNNTCSVSIYDLKQELKQAVENGQSTIEMADTTGQTKVINVESLSDFLTNTVGQLQITQFAYASIDMENPGGYFIDTLQGLNVTLDNYGSDFKALAQSVHDTLSSTSSSTIDKISQLSSFFGFSAANSDSATLMSNDFDVTQYTGVNPVQAWAAGLDINLSSIVGIVDAYIKVAKMVWGGIGKVVKAIFKTATKYISDTFVDPVDYKVEGDYIGYFSTPAKVVINYDFTVLNPPINTTASNAGDTLVLFRDFMDRAGNFSPYYINCHSVLYRVLKYNDDIYYERYVRPINYKALYKDLTSIDYSTVDGCYELFDTLERNDYQLPSSTPELEVYRGIIFAYALSSIWSYCIYNAATLDYGSSIGRATGEFINNTTANAALYEIGTLIDQVKAAIQWCITYPNGGINAPGLPTIAGLMTNELLRAEVTNVDFINLLTKTMCLVNNIETAVTASNLNDYGSLSLNGYTCLSAIGDVPSYNSAAALLSYHYPITFLGLKRIFNLSYESTFGLVYMPYLHNSDTKFDTNATVKTDQMNAQAIDNLFKGVLTAAAVVAAFIISKKAIAGLKSSIIANTALYNSKSIQLATALSNGDSALADNITSEMKVLLTRNKFSSAALGVFGVSMGDAVAQLNNTSVSLGKNITKSLSNTTNDINESINAVADKIDDVRSLIQ